MFTGGFEKIAAPRWLKYLKQGGPAAEASMEKALGLRGTGGKDFKKMFRPNNTYLTVPEMHKNKMYEKIPGLGIIAPLQSDHVPSIFGRRSTALPGDGRLKRVLGHEGGNVTVYHGTPNRKEIINKGLIANSPVTELGSGNGFFAHTTTDKSLARAYAKQRKRGKIVEMQIPKKEVKYVYDRRAGTELRDLRQGLPVNQKPVEYLFEKNIDPSGIRNKQISRMQRAGIPLTPEEKARITSKK